MNNPWELYEDHKQFAKATREIEKAWTEAKAIAPSKPSSERAYEAELLMFNVLKQWRHVGACDTEPLWVLRDRVQKHFGCRGDYI